MVVNGTSSVTSTSLSQSPRIGTVDGDGPFEDLGNLLTNFADRMDPSGTWSGYVDLDNYDFAALAGEFPDQVVARAQTDVSTPTTETEGYEAYTLYKQAITTVTVTDNGTGNGGLPDRGHVKVARPERRRRLPELRSSSPAPQRTRTSRTRAVRPTFGPVHATNGNGGRSTSLTTNCNGVYQSSAGDVTAPPFLAGGTATSMSIVSTPEGRRPVGSSTTETVTVKNGAGAPIVGRQVRFTRTGPDGSSEVVFRTTDAAGKASLRRRSAPPPARSVSRPRSRTRRALALRFRRTRSTGSRTTRSVVAPSHRRPAPRLGSTRPSRARTFVTATTSFWSAPRRPTAPRSPCSRSWARTAA